MKSILNLTFSKMYFKFNPLYRGRINLCHFILNSKFVHTLIYQGQKVRNAWKIKCSFLLIVQKNKVV